jgi:hypothetical protein
VLFFRLLYDKLVELDIEVKDASFPETSPATDYSMVPKGSVIVTDYTAFRLAGWERIIRINAYHPVNFEHWADAVLLLAKILRESGKRPLLLEPHLADHTTLGFGEPLTSSAVVTSRLMARAVGNNYQLEAFYTNDFLDRAEASNLGEAVNRPERFRDWARSIGEEVVWLLDHHAFDLFRDRGKQFTEAGLPMVLVCPCCFIVSHGLGEGFKILFENYCTQLLTPTELVDAVVQEVAKFVR